MADKSNDSKRNDLYSQPSGNPYASLSAYDEEDGLRQEPTDAQKHAYVEKLQNPYAYIAVFGDLDIADGPASEELTEGWVLKILSSYLPRSPRLRDRKAINGMAAKFVTQANGLAPEQRKFIKRRLLNMEPEGGRQLEAARTAADTIKIVLEKLLDEAKKQ